MSITTTEQYQTTVKTVQLKTPRYDGSQIYFKGRVTLYKRQGKHLTYLKTKLTPEGRISRETALRDAQLLAKELITA